MPAIIPKGTTYGGFMERLRSMTPEERMAALQTGGEIVGGTLGAMAGGLTPLAIPGAGAGAVAGHNIAGWVGKAAGLPMPKRTGGEEALNQATVLGLNAGGEGLGRAIPPAFRVAKTAAGNAIRKALRPDEAHQVLVNIADEYGIPLNIAQRSNNGVLTLIQAGLDRLPFASSAMRRAYKQQHTEWLNGMKAVLDRVRVGEITPEEFQRIAREGVAKLKSELATATSNVVGEAGSKIHPTPVSKFDAGTAAKEKHAAQLGTVAAWSEKEYGPIKEAGKAIKVDVSPFAQQAEETIATFPDLKLSAAIFDKGAIGKLSAASQMAPTEKVVSDEAAELLDKLAQGMGGVPSYGQLNPAQQASARAIAEKMGVKLETVMEPKTMTLEQAIKVRSRLLRRTRGFNRNTTPEEREAVYALIDGLDESLEASVANVPEYADLYKKLKETNAVYRSKMEALRPPRTYGKPGNVAAGRIERAELPENLPNQLSQSPTLSKGTQTALSDAAVSDIGPAGGPPALSMLRRSMFDDAVQGSTVPTPLGASRVSPTKLSERIGELGANGELFGAPLPSQLRPEAPMFPYHSAAQQPPSALPPLVRQEQRLYGGRAANAVEEQLPDSMMLSLFPKGAPAVADDSLKLLREAGAEDEGRRAFGDMLLDRSQTQSKSMVGETFVNPMSLTGRLRQYRSTVPTVLGEKNAKDFTDLTGVGRLITRDELINPSGTARALEVLQAIGGAGTAAYGMVAPKENESRFAPLAKYAALTVAAPYLGARAFNNPNLARSLTSAPKSVSLSLLRPEMGVAGRLLANRNKLMPLMPRREEKQQAAPDTLPADFFDGAQTAPDTLPADFFDQQQ